MLEHNLISLPPYRTFRNGEIRECKTRYIQLQCACEKKIRVRTYYICSPGVIICGDCYQLHLLKLLIEHSHPLDSMFQNCLFLSLTYGLVTFQLIVRLIRVGCQSKGLDKFVLFIALINLSYFLIFCSKQKKSAIDSMFYPFNRSFLFLI